MVRFARRVRFFALIVWRPVTGLNRDEPPMGGWRAWWHHGMSVRTAWKITGIFY